MMTNDIDDAWKEFKEKEKGRKDEHAVVAKVFGFETTQDLYSYLRDYIDTAHRDAYLKGIRTPEVAEAADELFDLIRTSSREDLKNYKKIPLEWLLKLVLRKK